MTIVGLVPPVYEAGELLIDGGYLNNIPVDVMRSMGVDMVRTFCTTLFGLSRIIRVVASDIDMIAFHVAYT
jgi:predicted acylesterase/phospholipase RssA